MCERSTVCVSYRSSIAQLLLPLLLSKLLLLMPVYDFLLMPVYDWETLRLQHHGRRTCQVNCPPTACLASCLMLNAQLDTARTRTRAKAATHTQHTQP